MRSAPSAATARAVAAPGLLFSYFLELSIAQISSVRSFGSTESAVTTRLSRIRKKLQGIPYRPQPSAD